MTLVSKTFELYGKTYTFESGELAKQATGACLVKQGDTTMLDTVVVSKERKNYDFFPLTVDFNEKMYAAGRIPGGYLKREGRPSEKATLTARMIDRPIRPSFPDGFRNEVHIVATSLVADQVNPFDVINVMGASLAMTLGGVPFEGPLACVRIGRNVETGEFIVNPTYEERENSDLDLELGGSADFISMVEAGAEEISEDDMLAAMKFGQEALAAFCQAQDEFVAEWEQVNGPIVKKDEKTGKYTMVSVGPTTSMRMEKFEKEFVEKTGVKVIIGKGGMGPNTEYACKNYKAIHCVFPAGCAVVAATHVEQIVEAQWRDLGMPETLWHCDVKELGPLIVSIDPDGRNLFEENKITFNERKDKALEEIYPQVSFIK